MARNIRFQNRPSPYYEGPVTYVDPGSGYGRAGIFCPRCGSVYFEYVGIGFRCLDCRRTFVWHSNGPSAEGKEFSVYCNGSLEYEHLPLDDVNHCARKAIKEKENVSRLDALATRYYGSRYLKLDSPEYAGDPEYHAIRKDLRYDIPSVEIDNMCIWHVPNMEVADRYIVPGTSISIVRTKNSKHRKGRKWLR